MMRDSASSGLTVARLSHAYDSLTAVREISFSITAGEVVCLLGPSGCGKSTTLRLIAGLERLQRGRIEFNGECWADERRTRPPEMRHVGLVFQDFALFPHLTVEDNVAFGLKGSRSARHVKALSYLARVGLARHAASYPHQLSGGEQQRVALARALAPQPSVMLLDEPFSGLDTRLRDQVRDDTLALLKSEGVATLLVTHDPEEAMRMADRIILMRKGRIEQEGSPDTLYHHPISLFAARFMSEANIDTVAVENGIAKTPFGSIPAPSSAQAQILIRPENLEIGAQAGNGLTAKVEIARSLGAFDWIEARDNAGRLWRLRQVGRTLPKQGDTIILHARADQIHIFPSDRDI